jgi:hypothetical protein
VHRAAVTAVARAVAAAALAIGARAAHANPADAPAAPRLAALVPADDARRAIAIGRGGEVFEPDGNGAWIHRLPCTTATPVVAAGRAGAAIVALGDGVVYRLAGNGWSAIRLVQHGKAILGGGTRALAAVGRQLFALDPMPRGEPTRIAQAPSAITAIGAGAAAIVATDTGLFRLTAGKLVAIAALPDHPRLVSDRWAIVDRGALELATGRITPWPAGLSVGPAAAAGDSLVAVASGPDGLELVTIAAGKLARDRLGITVTPGGAAVGATADRAGRAVVALADGRIAVRGPTGWTTTQVVDEPPPERHGMPPATSR